MGIYTRYEPDPTEHPPTGDAAWIDDQWLEETDKRLNSRLIRKIIKVDNTALRDQDRDGYLEISQKFLERFYLPLAPQVFPLATYFAEPADCNGEKTEQRARLRKLPRELRRATESRDFLRARAYFTNLASESDNPLQSLQPLLSQHLTATGTHMGGNVDESVNLETLSGFSVRYDGRLRFDCVLFAELAQSDLHDIPGIKTTYIFLDTPEIPSTPTNPDPPQPTDHVVVVISDETTKGRHLLISDDDVAYIEVDDIWGEVKKRFPDYAGYYKGQTVNDHKNPF